MSKNKPVSLARIVIATSVGNALEWFDIAIYGFFAVYVAKHFFPASSESASLLLTFGSFGASYLVRPLGGVVLGAYADRRGRKKALMLSVALMMIGTLLIAVMPGYQRIGVAAPIAVFVARLIQGFSAGGEFGASTAMLIEHAPHRRGFLASWQFATQGLSGLLAALSGFLLTQWMTPAALSEWGWRIPFFFGLLIGPAGLYLRRFLEDAPTYVEAAHAQSPVREVFGHQKLRLLISIGALTVSTAVNYMLQYVPTFAIRELHLPASNGFAAGIVAALILTVVTPFAGLLSDRIGRRKQMAAAAVILAVSSYPAFAYMGRHASVASLFMVVAWFAVLKSVYFGALPALMAELFPVSTRATGMSVGYNIGVTVFGGFTPAIIVWLISATGDKTSPGYYLMFTAVLSLCALAGAGQRRPRMVAA
ncbi:MFS transporter [Chitinasiproducens palmae]|uniref:MFS transporter, MHS family, proline/betaine transporter n=1 Tax=Chitinasiproducens palmae TaxID=1770053 RepID=A0A1H2PLK8_9BURK|nr:MFS transporter [Chitinasiproducens palmae]SDV47376.1 MFS transporter, MHS family, proline/betaine transporter [Chitinasiproducens palmae]